MELHLIPSAWRGLGDEPWCFLDPLPLQSVKLHQCTAPAAQWGIRSNKSHLRAALVTGDRVFMTLWTGLQSQLLTSTQTSRRIIVSPTSAFYPLPTFAKEYQNKHTHLLSLSTIKKLLNKFLEYFHVAKKLLLKQSSPLTYKSYITLDFLMVPRTAKFTSRNGIKTHPEMEKERGEKSHPILVALVQRNISSLLYKHPLGFAQRMAWKWDTPISATQSPGSPVLPEQGLRAREQLLLSLLNQHAKKWQLTAPSI